MTATQIPESTRRALRQRSGGRCEKCGSADAVHAHHRQPRGMGGTMLKSAHRLSCLIHVCVQCHEGIERNRARALNPRHGWLVDRPKNPADVPALLHNPNYVGAARYLLHDDGTLTRVWDDDTDANSGDEEDAA